MISDWLDATLPSVEEIHRRLKLVIPETLDPQGWLTREMAAKTIFIMLYGYAVEGFDRWIRPTAVVDMNDSQAARQGPAERRAWLDLVQGPKRPKNVDDRWYSENTREPIRDETIREFVNIGVIVERAGIATTSPKPRYALQRSFAALMNPHISDVDSLADAIQGWQEANLSKGNLARLTLLRKGAGVDTEGVLVKLPNGEVRRLAPGPSSELTRAVIEELAPRFLEMPAVIMISESAQKLGYEAKDVSEAVGFKIDVSKALPDVILADINADPPLVVFVECVFSDGPVNGRRKKELEKLARDGGFDPKDCTYVTAFVDRIRSPYRKLATSLAWGSFVWFQTEPGNINYLCEAGDDQPRLYQLLRSRSGNKKPSTD